MKIKSNVNPKAKDRPTPSLSVRRKMPWIVLFLGMCLVPQVRAQAPLPFYEPFPGTYVNGEQLGAAGSSGALWNTGNSLSSSCARVQTFAALQYPGLTNIDAIAQSDGLSSRPQDTSSVKDRAATLTIPANTTLYASCLVNFQRITNASTASFFGLSPTATVGGSVNHSGAVIFVDPQGHLLVAKNSLTPATNTTYTLTISNTYLLVLRYKYNTGSPDQVDLWVNPTSLGNDATVPAPTITTTNNANVASFGSVAYFQAPLPTLFYLDEIRVATNWSGVTPTNAPPGNLYSVTGGGVGCAGASFNVGVSGSDSGVDYMLYTNGVFTGESTNGTGAALNFGPQNVTALYTVLATNPTTFCAGWMSSNATVSVTPAPNIAVQPVSALVATNALAAFTVTSAGNGLSYQWYLNGSPLSDVGHVAGSQTTNLTISPATTADVATTANGYYVKVSNPCGGFIYSVTNALTLHAPATLVWYGDGVSNLWDVAISTNWNYASDLGYPTNVFNFGDNVIFDDTSVNVIVNLANVDLSPTRLTVNGGGGQNYTLTGNGLAGGGSILMNSAGSVNLNIVNNETGGITISNGAVYFNGPAALGSGPINLAGGALIAPGTGLVNINNTINITGSNSIVAHNAPGGQPLVLNGPLNGIGGSLTFSNVTGRAATPNIQLTQSNLNLTLPVDLAVGGYSGAGLNIMGNNTSGTQTWSGVIAGGGGLQRNSAGGSTLLLNTNSFSGGVKLTAGNLGVGCDSSSASPPTVDYGPLGTGTFYIDTGAGPMNLFSVGGSRVIANPIAWATTNAGAAFVVGGTNAFTFTGSVDLNGNNRVIQVDDTGGVVMSGSFSDNIGYGASLTKTGNGALYLDGASSYIGATTNGAGLLAGIGSLSEPVFVNSGARLGAGDAGVIPGTFTINSDLTLHGNVFVRVNKSQAQSNDLVSVSGVLTNSGSGTVTVANVGSTLAVGDTFTIFSQAVSNGAALTVTGGGATWSNNLAVDGSIHVLSVSTLITNSPAITNFSLAGDNVVIHGTNGQAGGTCYLLTATNLATPRNQWKTVATNVLGGNNYTFIGTNAVINGSVQQFFMLSSTNYNP